MLAILYFNVGASLLANVSLSPVFASKLAPTVCSSAGSLLRQKHYRNQIASHSG